MLVQSLREAQQQCAAIEADTEKRVTMEKEAAMKNQVNAAMNLFQDELGEAHRRAEQAEQRLEEMEPEIRMKTGVEAC